MKLGSYIILYCQAYLRYRLDFFKSNYGPTEKYYLNYHHKLLRFHAIALLKNELFETVSLDFSLFVKENSSLRHSRV